MPTLPSRKTQVDFTIDQTSANFPSCKHFWRMDNNGSDGNTLADEMGTSSITTLGADLVIGTDANGVNYLDVSAATGTNIAANAGTVASLYELTTKPFMYFTVVDTTGGTPLIGHTTGERINANDSGNIVGDASVICGPFAINGVQGRATAIFTFNDAASATTGQTSYGVASDLASEDAPSPVATSTSGITTMNSFATGKNLTANNGTGLAKVYGLALFEFATAIPDDWKEAVTWMTQQWLAGNKVIYPRWKDLT